MLKNYLNSNTFLIYMPGEMFYLVRLKMNKLGTYNGHN